MSPIRDRYLIADYLTNKRTLQKSAARFGLSAERVRQILVQNGIYNRHQSARVKPLRLTPEFRIQKRKAQFWGKVDITPDPDGCWEWLGYRGKRAAYGRCSMRGVGRSGYAHVFAFILSRGREPRNWVLHHCDNPPCCNPKHLYDGTPTDNARDRDKRGRNGLVNRPHPSAGRRVLTPTQMAAVHRRSRSGETTVDIAKDFPVHQTTISRYIRQQAANSCV